MHRKAKLEFKTARSEIRKLNLKSMQEYLKFIKENNRMDLPVNPCECYSKNGWISWNDFLNRKGVRGRVPRNVIGKRLRNYSYLPYDQAKIIMKKFSLKNWNDWYNFRNTDLRPSQIPSTPERYYKDKGWVNMKDFLSSPSA
jgi:hypothetical protein